MFVLRMWIEKSWSFGQIDRSIISKLRPFQIDISSSSSFSMYFLIYLLNLANWPDHFWCCRLAIFRSSETRCTMKSLLKCLRSATLREMLIKNMKFYVTTWKVGDYIRWLHSSCLFMLSFICAIPHSHCIATISNCYYGNDDFQYRNYRIYAQGCKSETKDSFAWEMKLCRRNKFQSIWSERLASHSSRWNGSMSLW